MSAGPAVNDRILATLDALVRRPTDQPWGVRELAEDTGLSRSTVHRVLQALTERDLATQTAHATYTSGPRLRVLVDRLHRSHPLLGQARPLAQDLAAACDATILLSLYDPARADAFVALTAVPDGPVRYRLDPGRPLPLHAGAAGRAILAELPPDVLARLDLTAHTDETVTDPAELKDLLEQGRAQGVTVSVGQHIALAAGVAAPLHAAGLTGALSATRLRHETGPKDIARLAPLVREAADRASRLTPREHPPLPQGHTPPSPAADDSGGSAAARVENLITALCTAAPLPTGGRALARVLHGNPATTARLLDTALTSGLAVLREEHALAGPLLMRWAAILGPLESTGALVAPALHALAQETGETIALTEYDRTTGTARMTTVVPGSKPIHYSLSTDADVPLTAGAAGKAILAFLPDRTLDDLELVPYTDHTPLDRPRIATDLLGIRARGWATGDRERIPDAYGIAVPYFTDHGIAGSITATVPRHRADQLDPTDLAAHLAATAAAVTRLLSLRTTPPAP
ncbi:IclR family transcriptional regulator domain-containing protein [Streptomyces sp. NRRL F-5630]|uniref:IclR family transcriptional regulator domain-containing protein n=1 Tax=Streptomyces sp. NRRL F-5630 TaxID=1463864 RepID=UPI003EBCEBAC